jgi:hypothetical protein
MDLQANVSPVSSKVSKPRNKKKNKKRAHNYVAKSRIQCLLNVKYYISHISGDWNNHGGCCKLLKPFPILSNSC